MMPHDVVRRQTDDSLLLVPGDRFGSGAERTAVSRLHFHEHQRRAVARDDVQFATAAAVTPGENCVPAALELPARVGFPRFSQRNPIGLLEHADRRRKDRAAADQAA